MAGRSDGGATRQRRPPLRSEEGFTLLELAVVVAIIAILIAVLQPALTVARATAQDHAAQANIRTALVAANSAYIITPDSSFDQVTPAVLAADEPSLRWSPTEQTSGPGTISALNGLVAETGVWAIGLADDAGNGTCWYAFQSDNDAPWYGASLRTGVACDAKDAGSYASSREP